MMMVVLMNSINNNYKTKKVAILELLLFWFYEIMLKNKIYFF